MEIAAEFALPVIYHSNHKGTQAFGKSKIMSKLLHILLETNLFLVKIPLKEPWLPASKLWSKRNCRKTSPMGQKILHYRLCWSLSWCSELNSVYSMVSPGGRKAGLFLCFGFGVVYLIHDGSQICHPQEVLYCISYLSIILTPPLCGALWCWVL